MNIRSAAIAAAIVATLVACGGSDESKASNPEPTTTSTDQPQRSDPEPALSGADLVEEVRRVAAENFGIPPDEVGVGQPEVLTPSRCVVVGVRQQEVLDAGTEWYIQIEDGSLIGGGDDETLVWVAQSCFLDHGTVPDPDAAVSLVLHAGRPRVVRALDARSGPRELAGTGVEWEPPSVVASEDGFDVSFFVQGTGTFKLYHATSRIRPGEAKTDYRKLN